MALVAWVALAPPAVVAAWAVVAPPAIPAGASSALASVGFGTSQQTLLRHNDLQALLRRNNLSAMPSCLSAFVLVQSYAMPHQVLDMQNYWTPVPRCLHIVASIASELSP